MVRVLGIDPGTKSLDLCGLEDGRVYFEESLETVDVAKDPKLLIDAIEEALPVDLITGPSGYGVEITYLDEIPESILEDWYYTYILLTSREEIEKALKRGFIGAFIYYTMTQIIKEMKRRKLPVCFIPGVINLPTVPIHRKINKMDMGTADKLSVTVLATYDQARRLRIPYSEVSLILVEMGFGYNAVIGVRNGKIVDGFGGTTMPGPGFLTMSWTDLELVQLVGFWEKADVFTGGCISITGKASPEEFIENIENDEKCRIAWQAMMESIEKAVMAMLISVPKPKEIIVSGRLVRMSKVYDELVKRLSKIAPVRRITPLPGAKITKETAQGYVIIADGIVGGVFRELIEHMEIRRAKGTCIDYIYHPKFRRVKERLIPFKLK